MSVVGDGKAKTSSSSKELLKAVTSLRDTVAHAQTSLKGNGTDQASTELSDAAKAELLTDLLGKTTSVVMAAETLRAEKGHGKGGLE